MRIVVRIRQEVAEELRKALEDNYWRNFFQWERRLRAKGDLRRFKAVARFMSLRIEIRSDEHGPPHFHVISERKGASYTIETCERMAGKLDLNERLLKKWWNKNKGKLLQTWNETRPTDCPVGVMHVPAEWLPEAANKDAEA